MGWEATFHSSPGQSLREALLGLIWVVCGGVEWGGSRETTLEQNEWGRIILD